MNRNALRIGMTQTSYVNPNGLPAEGQITSARDMAMLARAIIRDMPEYEYFTHIPAMKFGRRITRNFNSLIGRYPGADGMKTGFICASGFNLVASATRNGKRMIAVVLGAPSSPVRAAKAAQLLERGFARTSGLSWLSPSLGTLAAMEPIAAEPPNLRDDMCGPKRKRPGHSESDDDNVAHRRRQRRQRERRHRLLAVLDRGGVGIDEAVGDAGDAGGRTPSRWSSTPARSAPVRRWSQPSPPTRRARPCAARRARRRRRERARSPPSPMPKPQARSRRAKPAKPGRAEAGGQEHRRSCRSPPPRSRAAKDARTKTRRGEAEVQRTRA